MNSDALHILGLFSVMISKHSKTVDLAEELEEKSKVAARIVKSLRHLCLFEKIHWVRELMSGSPFSKFQ